MRPIFRVFSIFWVCLVTIVGLLAALRSTSIDSSFWVASSRVVDGNRDIYLQLNGTSISRRLTTHPAPDYLPIWSPDGQWIAFESRRSEYDGIVVPAIYIIRPDGTELRKMGDVPGYESDRRIRWSPDSQHLEVFFQPVNGAALRFVANVYDGAWVNSVYTEASYSPAAWTQDGLWRLVPHVMSIRDGERLYRQRMSGGSQELVLDLDNYQTYDWSPDGEWITFGAFVDFNREIFRIRPDGRVLQNLTDSPTNESDPLWSPDGEWIYFLSDGGQGDSINLYRMRPDGHDVSPITSVSGTITGPIWSPDRQWILYIYEPLLQREWHLYRARPDGSAAQPIAEGIGAVPFVSWSPDGNAIAYSATGNVRQDIFVVNADGTSPRQLTHSTVPDLAPFWSPDGKWLIFRSQTTVLQINIQTGKIETLSDYHAAVDPQTHAHYWSPPLPEYGLISGWTPERIPDGLLVFLGLGFTLVGIPCLLVMCFVRHWLFSNCPTRFS